MDTIPLCDPIYCNYTSHLSLLYRLSYSLCGYTCQKACVGFQVLTAVVKKSCVFWDVASYGPLKANRRFGGTCLHRKSVDFQQTTRRYIPEDRIHQKALTFYNHFQELITNTFDGFVIQQAVDYETIHSPVLSVLLLL
jgi:hypothetical protein